MIKYMELGGDKLLSSIVMAGSHDAGITQGGSNAKTQKHEIGLQALMGVRLFDVRAAAYYVGGGNVEFKTFHGPKVSGFSKFTPTSGGQNVQNAPQIKARHMAAGTSGQDLASIFKQARDFVSTTGEFIFLKFDKSDHFPTIAQIARDTVGNQHLYSGNGCLNEMQLQDLGGRVFVLIMSKDYNNMQPNERVGTLPIYKLADKKNFFGKVTQVANYTPGLPGMQYLGKGGTSVMGTNISHKSTLKENEKKQTKLLQKLKDKTGQSMQGHQFLMGMMYWTATGTVRSIEKRNDYQWKHPDRLKELWDSGVGNYVYTMLPQNVVANAGQHEAGHIWKCCLPNFVMIDFADAKKCDTIYQFNHVPATQLITFDL